MATLDDLLRSLSYDYLNLLINGQAFSDVTFSIEGHLVHAHKCILAARSLYFRNIFCGGHESESFKMCLATRQEVIPVNSVSYEVFLLVLEFLYSGQISFVPQKVDGVRYYCGERGCLHTHCGSAVAFALDTLAAARSFGVEQLAFLAQKHLASMVEKASIEDVMRVLLVSRKQDMLWTTCSHIVAKSALPAGVLARFLPNDVIAKVEELRLKFSITHQHHGNTGNLNADKHHRMRQALDSSDIELATCMAMREGLNLDEALALHYSVENCNRKVVKELLELGVVDVNYPAGPEGKTPLHIAAEMVNPDMVAVLLDHHADPNARTIDGISPLDMLKSLTSDFLFKGAVPGLKHIEPNKLRLCLELVQSAAVVISREEKNANAGNSSIANYPPMSDHDHILDSRMVYLNLGATKTAQMVSGIDREDHRQHSRGHP